MSLREIHPLKKKLEFRSKKDIVSDMLVALDTDVIVAALRSPSGASRQVLKLLRARRIRAVATVNMLIEYESVLTRPEQRIATGLTVVEVGQFLDGLAALVLPVQPHFLWRPQLRDPDDEMVLEAAVNGGADAIVTFNRVDFLPAASRFGIDVVPPGSVLSKQL